MLVEFFGIPRERTGVAQIELQADTIGELLGTLEARFPTLGAMTQAGRVRSPYLISLNADRFVSDPNTALKETDSVLILSAQAGG
jgi:molybdopterin converting factor small subunit